MQLPMHDTSIRVKGCRSAAPHASPHAAPHAASHRQHAQSCMAYPEILNSLCPPMVQVLAAAQAHIPPPSQAPLLDRFRDRPLSPSTRRHQLLREARLHASLSHPHIIKMYAAFKQVRLRSGEVPTLVSTCIWDPGPCTGNHLPACLSFTFSALAMMECLCCCSWLGSVGGSTSGIPEASPTVHFPPGTLQWRNTTRGDPLFTLSLAGQRCGSGAGVG